MPRQTPHKLVPAAKGESGPGAIPSEKTEDGDKTSQTHQNRDDRNEAIARERDKVKEEIVRCLLGNLYCKSEVINLLESLYSGKKGQPKGVVESDDGVAPHDAGLNRLSIEETLDKVRVLLKNQQELLKKKLSKSESNNFTPDEYRRSVKQINSEFLLLTKNSGLPYQRIISCASGFAQLVHEVSLLRKRYEMLRDSSPDSHRAHDENVDHETMLSCSLKTELELKFMESRLKQLAGADNCAALRELIEHERKKRRLVELLETKRANKVVVDRDDGCQQEIAKAERELAELMQAGHAINRGETFKEEFTAIRYAMAQSYLRLGISPIKAQKCVEAYHRLESSYVQLKNRLINDNQALVADIAWRLSGSGVDPDDLMAAGNFGLIKAADRFDPDLGKFGACAGHWIHQEMIDFINAEKNKRGLGTERTHELRALGMALRQELGYSPNSEELMAAWSKQSPTSKSGKKATDESVGNQELVKLMLAQLPVLSLNPRSSSASDTDAASLDIPGRGQTPLEVVIEKERERRIPEVVNRTLAALSPIEAKVLRMRFGLGGEIQNLAQVAQVVKLSREGARRVEIRALEKARKILGEGEEILLLGEARPGAVQPKPRKKRASAIMGRRIPKHQTSSSEDSMMSAHIPPSTESVDAPSSTS